MREVEGLGWPARKLREVVGGCGGDCGWWLDREGIERWRLGRWLEGDGSGRIPMKMRKTGGGVGIGWMGLPRLGFDYLYR